ncbi:MAG TPA: redoxin domain-containing protein [Acidimicrobiia bacterium]|nr:redoxin domain-containing protein [Acidimicrobiia bacterium]
MGQIESNVEDHGGRVAAIAVTATFSQIAFASQLDIGFPLLSDWGGAVADAYGVRYDSWKGHEGIAKRSIFVIDPQGVIRYKWVTEDALQLPDLAEAVAVLGKIGEP